MTIEQLATAARKGDADAFASLMESQQARLYRIAYAFLHNEPDALDAVQETAYRAFRSIRKLKSPDVFPTWLIRILLNHCADERKRKQRFVSTESIPDRDSWDSHSDPDLTAAVAKLGTAAKQIIILNYYEGFSLTEIAEIMDCPPGTVKSRLHRALGQLREELDLKEGGYLNESN